MARSKPISRKVRRDLNSIALRDDFNRGKQLRRDKDKVKNISNQIIDMDSAIMYYFNEVIKPTVTENKETIKVPVMYASPERWATINKNGHLRLCGSEPERVHIQSLRNLAPDAGHYGRDVLVSKER